MARLHEHQGKELLSKAGIPVPVSSLASSPEEAQRAAQRIGGPVVLKAQVWATGRMKAGGICFARGPAEAADAARGLIGREIKGLEVRTLLVEQQIDIDRELYVSVIVNDSRRIKGPMVILSSEGGTGVEEVASRNPERVRTVAVDYRAGIGGNDIEELMSVFPADDTTPKSVLEQIADVIARLYNAFTEADARAAEINPLVITKDGRVVAADCRFTIDDNSVFRHPEFGIALPRDMEREPTELERIAWQIEEGDFRGTGYFTQMSNTIVGEGWLGFQGIGGGGAMLAASALVTRGFKIADYADTSGDPPASKIYRVIRCILAQPVDAYVLMASCLANQEQWHHAHAIVKALREIAEKRPGFPALLLIAGNKEREAHEIIEKGLSGTSLRWELYGRDHIYATDFIAERVRALVQERREEGRRGVCEQA